MSHAAHRSPSALRLAGPARWVGLTAASAASWFAWMGWDHEYQTDPVTGVASGPYEAWQVAGCVLTLLAVGVVAVWLRVHPAAGITAMTLGLTAAWCTTETPGDETGMSGVGALMVLVGSGLGSTVWFAIGSAIRPRLRS